MEFCHITRLRIVALRPKSAGMFLVNMEVSYLLI
jgi:hypothetical protein